MAGVLQIKRGATGVGSLNDGEFYLNKGINAVQIGSGSSILTLLPLNQTVTGDIILNGNIYANNLNISSSYALSSSYAQYAATASYIIAAGTSISASQAATASYILSSNVYGPYGFNSIVTASFAVTASYAPGYLQTSVTQSMLGVYLLTSSTGSMLSPYLLNSQTGSFITSNQTSSFATNTDLNNYVPNSQTSSFVTNTQTGSFVTNNQTGSFILTNQTASMLSPYLLNSQTSSFVTNTQTGSFVTNSQTASFILTSQTSSMTVGTASYVSSSNVYGPDGFNSILTASYSHTASLAFAIVGGASAVSSSYPFNVTGSTIYSFNSNRLGTTIYNVPTYQNIIIGESAAASASFDITSSIFFGNYAGYRLKRSVHVIYIGENAGQSTIDVTGSAFIGYNAGTSTKAIFSNFIGYNAGSNAVLASNSNFIGYNTGRGAVSASYSTLIGYQSGYKTGSGVVGIGNNNIIIGTNITLDDRRSDSINIGGILFGTGSYSNINGRPYSGSAVGRIGINTINPTYNLHVSGTVAFPSLPQSSSAYIVMYDSGSGQLFYTASNALVVSGSGAPGSGFPFSGSAVITGSLLLSGSGIIITGSLEVTNGITGSLFGTASNISGGQTNYIAVWKDDISLTTGSLYQTGGFIGINTTNPTTTFEVSGSVQISNHLKLGTIPFPTYASSTGSKLDIIDYIENPIVHPEGYMARSARSIYGSSSFTNFSPYRYEIVSYIRNLELAPGQTYNIASSNWNARKISLGASLGIGVSGSGTSPNTIYNSGYTLNSTNYAILGKIDYWPEFDEGTLPRQYNGQYSVFGTHVDIQAGSGSTIEKLNSYSAGGFKSFVNTSVDRFINYYSTVETESFSTSKINNIYGFYSAPLYRSYATQSYGFYQSGSNDINYFEGRVGIGLGSITPSGSLYVSGSIYFPSLTTSSVGNVVMYDTASGKLYYTSSNATGGSGTGFPFSGSAVITGSLLVSGSGLIVTGSINVSDSITGSLFGTASWAVSASNYIESDPIFLSKSGSLATTGSNNFIGNQWITGSLTISGSASTLVVSGTINVTNGITGSLFGTASNVEGGKVNYLPLWKSATSLTTSSIYQTGSYIGIGIITPTNTLHIAGTTLISASGETTPLTIYGSASVATPLLSVNGSNGEMLNIFDNLSGSIFEVNNASGNPILEVNSDNTIKVGLWPVPANYTSYKTIITSASTAYTIFTIPTASANAAFFDYVLTSGSNMRAGNFIANWYAETTNINYYETSAEDIGNTNVVTMSADIYAGNFRYLAQTNLGDWSIKTIIRYI